MITDTVGTARGVTRRSKFGAKFNRVNLKRPSWTRYGFTTVTAYLSSDTTRYFSTAISSPYACVTLR